MNGSLSRSAAALLLVAASLTTSGCSLTCSGFDDSLAPDAVGTATAEQAVVAWARDNDEPTSGWHRTSGDTTSATYAHGSSTLDVVDLGHGWLVAGGTRC